MQEHGVQSSEAGITLVELLVAMAIGVILAGGIFQVFVGSSDSYQMTTQLSRVQENGRFAMQILRQDVRGAGYLGCTQDVANFFSTLNDGTEAQAFIFDYRNAIFGFSGINVDEYKWRDNENELDLAALNNKTGLNIQVTAAEDQRPLPGSDIIIVRGVESDEDLYLGEKMPDTSAVLRISGKSSRLKKEGGDFLFVTDCQGATLFQSTEYMESSLKIQHNPGNSVSPGNKDKYLGHPYSQGSEFLFAKMAIYYVRNNQQGQPSLYMKRNLEPAIEIVEGVEMMKVRYGEDTNNDGTVDVYVDAGNVDDWANVRSVHIGLLLRTVGEMGRGPFDNQTYDVSGDGNADFGPAGDRRLRLVMSGNVGLRNRLR